MIAINNPDSLIICVDDLYIPQIANWYKDISAFYSTICEQTLLGYINRDNNFNCQTDLPPDTPLKNQIVRITNSQGSTYGGSNKNGKFWGGVDTGWHTLSLIPW
jgi:hypothetical protein